MIKTLLSFFVLLFMSMNVHGHRKHSVLSSQSCDEASRLYSCNGRQRSCRAFLVFKARPPFNTIRAISSLTSSSLKELARINNETGYEAIFKTNTEVIIPVNCSCLGQYYQANASVTLGPNSGTDDRAATDLFRGLSTCESRERANSKVPLRCSCPTKNQAGNGTKYLMTYPVNSKDIIPGIAERFNVSLKSIFDANELSEINNIPMMFTHVPMLIPLSSEPSSSQKLIHHNIEPRIPPGFPDLRSKNPESNQKLFVVFGVIAGCSVLVLILVIAFFVHKKRSSSNELLPRSQVSENLRVEVGVRVFGIDEIHKATRSFSPENRIKGSVYRGEFGENQTLAVKKTKKDPSMEVNTLKKLNHVNVTKLVGVCKHHNRSYMVFEYMENGSLREWLLRNNGSNKSWRKRIEIALDIANGLNYLHSFTEPGYVHKNIKSSNVLLGKNTRAKIANFGLAGPATDLTAARHVVGTSGYVAPEYLENGVPTTKIDVFAFGVVVLELLSGKKAMAMEDGKRVLLYGRIMEIMESGGSDVEGELGLFVDCGLKEDDRRFRGFALRVAELSVACLSRDPESRPSMSEVVSSLSKILADLHRFEL